MKISPRHRTRELVLQGLYALKYNEKNPDDILEDVLKEEDLSKKNIEFARTLYMKVIENSQQADRVIASLAENWELDRIALIDRIILQMALVELMYIPDVPEKVVLNEAIELAKTFSTNDSSAFVNGILDNYLKKSKDSKKQSID